MKTLSSLLYVLNSMEGIGSVVYENAFNANIRADGITTPLALLRVVEDWKLDTSNGFIFEKANCALFFLQCCDLEFNSVKVDTTIEEMKQHALNFIRKVSKSAEIEIEDDEITLKSVYDHFDRNMAGVCLEFTAKELQGSCYENY